MYFKHINIFYMHLHGTSVTPIVSFMKKSYIFKKIFIGSALFTLLNAPLAFAKAASIFEEFQNKCNRISCETPYTQTQIYDLENSHNDLPQDAFQKLSEKAVDQAQIWGDTILEGDYYADGKTRLLTVTALYKDNVLVGYHFTYFEKAWFTGSCHVNDNFNNLEKCQEGRIVEGSYVTKDMTAVTNDIEQYAQFQNKD